MRSGSRASTWARRAAWCARGPTGGLRKIADETGGGYFELKKTEELGPAFTRVAQELHSQYLLGFTPQKLDNKIHKLEVKIDRRRRTRRAPGGATSRPRQPARLRAASRLVRHVFRRSVQMSKVWTATGLALALVATAACGKSAEQQRQEEAAKQLQEAAKKMEQAGTDAQKAAEKGAEGMAAGMEALAKGLGAAAGVANGGKVVDPVSFRDLQASFADLGLGEDEADRRDA